MKRILLGTVCFILLIFFLQHKIIAQYSARIWSEFSRKNGFFENVNSDPVHLGDSSEMGSIYSYGYVYSSASLSGFLSGGLHALSGPDHLAALLPLIFGKTRWASFRIGAIWGFGHGLSASLLGAIGVLLEGELSNTVTLLEKVSQMNDFTVSLTMIVIGMTGIYETSKTEEATNGSRKVDDKDIDLEQESSRDGTDNVTSNGSTGVGGGLISSTGPKPLRERASDLFTVFSSTALMAIFINGFFLGLSWDGIPSLTPALSFPPLLAPFLYLGSYCMGTTIMMASATCVISQSTSLLGQNAPETLPKSLALLSSAVAIGIGSFWGFSAVFGRSSLLMAILAVVVAILTPLIVMVLYARSLNSSSQLSTNHNAKDICNSDNSSNKSNHFLTVWLENVFRSSNVALVPSKGLGHKN